MMTVLRRMLLKAATHTLSSSVFARSVRLCSLRVNNASSIYAARRDVICAADTGRVQLASD